MICNVCDFLVDYIGVEMLVSDEDASCASGVICLFVYY